MSNPRCIVWECPAWRDGPGCGFISAGTDCASPRWRARYAEYKKAGIVTGGIFISRKWLENRMKKSGKLTSAQIIEFLIEVESMLLTLLGEL